MTGDGSDYLRRAWKWIKNSRGLVNTTDLVVASGATIILAAGVASVSLAGIDQAKLGKAQPDAQALASAMQQFFKDTGKWPGQAEVAESTETGAKAAKYLVTAQAATDLLPSFKSGTFVTTAATCQSNSLEGFATGTTIAALPIPVDGDTGTSAASNTLNINDYLVRKPNATKYPNWRGPYMQGEITSDPFGRVWLINTMPLFCAETVTVDSTKPYGDLGNAWIISSGPNRTLTTSLKSAKLDPEGDDAGTSLSKLTTRTTNSGF